MLHFWLAVVAIIASMGLVCILLHSIAMGMAKTRSKVLWLRRCIDADSLALGDDPDDVVNYIMDEESTIETKLVRKHIIRLYKLNELTMQQMLTCRYELVREIGKNLLQKETK